MQQEKSSSPYVLLYAIFCVLAVLSNILSAKLFLVPGFNNFSIPAGLIIYPATFILSDLVTEIYGSKKSKQMVYAAFGMNLLSFLILQISVSLPTKDTAAASSFATVFGNNGIIIFSSLIAYLFAQILDVKMYTLIKRWTNGRFLWLRNNGSTFIAQIADTLTVNTIFLYFGLGMTWEEVVPIMVFSYLYKIFFSLAGTPLFYFAVSFVRKRSKEITSLT